MIKAFAYARTSSANNVGETKDSEHRQREAISIYAATNGIEIVETFYDPAVRGTDAIENRPGFATMLTRIESTGIRFVIVEDSSRLARSVLVHELAIVLLTKRGVRVLDARGDDLTSTADPTRTAMSQVVAAFSQLEKARLVAKLRHGRDTKRAVFGRCEGCHGFNRTAPELVAAAHQLAEERHLRRRRNSPHDLHQDRLCHTGNSARCDRGNFCRM
jgi:DNA invertase Pin-like site-specific DNA recombinase